MVTPDRFLRCGYERTPSIVGDQMIKDHSDDIVNFLNIMGINGDGYREHNSITFANSSEPIDIKRRGMGKFIHALAYMNIAATGFGSKERQISSAHEKALIDATIKVVETKQVMTGKYFPPAGGGGGGYEGDDYWYECGGLENQKSNRILKVDIDHPDYDWVLLIYVIT